MGTDSQLAAVRYLSEILPPRLIDVDSFIHRQICNWLSGLQALHVHLVEFENISSFS